MKAQEKARFFQQLAGLLDSGMSVQQSLSLAGRDLGTSFQNYLQKASATVAAGQDLAVALSRPPHYFNNWTISLIQSAEYSGALPEACRRLAIAFQRQQQRDRLYHSIKFATLAIIWSGLLLIAALLQGNAAILLQPGFWILGVFLLVLLLGAFYLLNFPAIAGTLQQLVQGVPILGQIMRARSMLYFAELELPLRCGISLATSLELLQKYIPDPALKAKVATATERVLTGKPLSQSIQGKIPAIALQMIRTGEETGNLDDALQRVAEYYESELERLLQQLKSILIPLSIIAVGGLIALLGIWGMTSVINLLPQ